jgi:alpha-L-rhamnosidase
MNSFNHYAYGSVLAWIYKTAAGIAPDPSSPGFKNVIMAPRPDRRLGWVKAEYKSAAGLIKSAWCYENGKWIWDFTVPEGATATVSLPGGGPATSYPSGTHHIERTL